MKVQFLNEANDGFKLVFSDALYFLIRGISPISTVEKLKALDL